MTHTKWTQKCHERTGQSLELCEAYRKARIPMTKVSNQEVVDRRGLTREEDKALEDHYRTPLEVIPDCSPGCPLCHPKLPREQWDK